MKHSDTEEACGLQRVDRMMEPPVVGRVYLVPTVRYVYCGIEADWPVMGPLHDDVEHLRFPYFHYHVDPRFIPQPHYDRLVDGAFRDIDVEFAANPLNQRDHSSGYVSQEDALKLPAGARRKLSRAFPQIVLRRRKMVRELSYPRRFIDGQSADHVGAERFKRMWRSYAGRTAERGANGLICPHRNYPLGNAKPDADGILTCPLHGLRICSRTGLVEPGHGELAPDTCQGAPAAHGVRLMESERDIT